MVRLAAAQDRGGPLPVGHGPSESCLCCPAGGGPVAVTDVLRLGSEQRISFIHCWRRVCSSALPPTVARHIFFMAATKRTRVVRRQVLPPNLDSLMFCGDGDADF